MTSWLKQSTAVSVKLGPFVDNIDGYTAETALTMTQAELRLTKNGGDIAQKNETTSAVHDELGYYDVLLNATDTDTLGLLRVLAYEAGALPVWQDFMVVPANIWDSFFGADQLLVEVATIATGPLDDITEAILDGEIIEPAGVFSWGSATLRTVIAWLSLLSRNKMVQTSLATTVRNDGDSADIASSAIAEEDGTFTRGEWS